MKIRAFTLSEVLITLGVIGVVAAMTLPTLIQNYQEQEYVNKLKKAISAIEQAKIKSMYEDNIDFSIFPLDGLYNRESHEKFANYFKRNMTVIMDCSIPENSNAYCFKKGGDNRVYKIDRKTLATWLPENSYRGFITTDGVSYFFYSGTKYMYIDVNSPLNGPNALGYDVFAFKYDNKGNLLPLIDSDSLDECKTEGYSCSKWVLMYGNQAYRRCPSKVEYLKKTKC